MRRSVQEVAQWSEDELCWWWARSMKRPLSDDHGMLLREAATISAQSVVEKKSQHKVAKRILPEAGE